MRTKYILGNWKMNGTQEQAGALVRKIGQITVPPATGVVLFPPFTFLAEAGRHLHGKNISLGGQDCSPEADGAFTGDISASLLKDAGCRYVILGHSERRMHHGEPDTLVRRKAEAALAAGLIPVICVGESLEQRASGDYASVIRAQVENSLPGKEPGAFLIAYEPVWAIGSGKTPSLAQISEVHKTIATVLHSATSGADAPIVYGGSVKAANAGEILASEEVDGVLVGGASLKADEFCAMISAAR